MPPTEVFLSHSSADRTFANGLVRVLRRHGIAVWYSRTNIVGAQQWHDEIGAALARCNRFIVVLSPDSVRSEWVKHELLFALNSRRYKGRIVPLLYRPCHHHKLSWTLSSFQFVDFTRRAADGYRELLRIWGIGYRPK
ncbi:MAG: toll/interleukin-1 receptor domain-containing protein [Pyrinomonadaceae bacterium]